MRSIDYFAAISSVKMFGEVWKRFVGIRSTTPSLYTTRFALQSRTREADTFQQKKQKQEGKKKNMGEGFHFTPDEQTEPRGLFVSIPHAPSFNREISDKIIVILYLYEKSSGRKETIRRLKLATHRIKI